MRRSMRILATLPRPALPATVPTATVSGARPFWPGWTRDFLKLSAAGIMVGVFPGCATSGSEIVKKSGQRVVIVGGGFGGATAAKYIRMWGEEKIEGVVVERNPLFVSCPMSNTVLGGSRTIDDLTQNYDTLKKKYGVKLIHG